MTDLAPSAAFAAVILAGGRAARLGGADKPGLTVGTATLAAAAVSAAAAAGAQRVILVGPPRPELQPLAAGLPGGLTAVQEDPPAAGPVPALRCGLAGVLEPWTAVLAADLPFFRGPHLQALLRAAEQSSSGAVLTDADGRAQWLAGCWLTGPLRAALQGYQGASLHGLFQPLRPVLFRCDIAAGEPPPWLDCDTAGELDLARQLQAALAGQGGGPWPARAERPETRPRPGGC